MVDRICMLRSAHTYLVDEICMLRPRHTYLVNEICMLLPRHTDLVDEICMLQSRHTYLVDEICMPRIEISTIQILQTISSVNRKRMRQGCKNKWTNKSEIMTILPILFILPSNPICLLRCDANVMV